MFNIVIQLLILFLFYENLKQVYSISVKFRLFMFFLRSLQTQTGQMEDHAHHVHKAGIRIQNILEHGYLTVKLGVLKFLQTEDV